MKKILLVDDEKDIREILAEKLSKSNYAIITADNGKTAVIDAASKKPDLVLLDVAMPIMDGYETCMKLKENNTTKHIPIIFLTGKDLDPQGIINRYKELGAVGYLPKPSTLKELLEKIKDVLGE